MHQSQLSITNTIFTNVFFLILNHFLQNFVLLLADIISQDQGLLAIEASLLLPFSTLVTHWFSATILFISQTFYVETDHAFKISIVKTVLKGSIEVEI